MITWYEHAPAYTEAKWAGLAPAVGRPRRLRAGRAGACRPRVRGHGAWPGAPMPAWPATQTVTRPENYGCAVSSGQGPAALVVGEMSPSRSSWRRRWVRTLAVMPSTRSRRSLNRCRPCARCHARPGQPRHRRSAGSTGSSRGIARHPAGAALFAILSGPGSVTPPAWWLAVVVLAAVAAVTVLTFIPSRLAGRAGPAPVLLAGE
jgi:hypothetical protein